MESILGAFSDADISRKSVTGFALNDIIDILIITFIMYTLIIWIKESRAWSLLKGFLVILALNVGAYVFNLYTVRWVIENTFNVGLIAVIVLFQPELRKALEQLGKGRFISSFTGTAQFKVKISPEAKEEIIRAVTAMSEVQTGALIVLEQEISTDEYLQTGIPIDGAISRQLLINIFEDKTPLHDGAVIIRNNRIAAACCILPLTQDDIDKKLGTRHRAAVGTSQLTDAFVIVVSEETGDISVAQGGVLRRSLSEERLRSVLSVEQQEEKRKLTLWKGRKSVD